VDATADSRSVASSMPQRELPRTVKGRATRDAILRSARTHFGEAGYTATRVQDIAEGAGLSLGAFYRYFDSRRDVLLTILAEFFDGLYETSRAPWHTEDPRHSVRETTRRYLEAYAQNADLYRITFETFLTESDVTRLWEHARQMFYRRIERSLRRSQTAGGVRTDLDPTLSAALLGGMTEHFAFLSFVVGDPAYDVDLDVIADQISELWTRSVAPDPPRDSEMSG
jgi:AcrR family transcriptional regulator